MTLLGNSKLDWSAWFYGIVAGFIGGGASAVISGFTVAVSDPKDYAVGTGKFFGLVFTIFISNGAISAFMFLKQNPLPRIRTVTTVETTTKQADPPAIVKTTVETTEMIRSDVRPATAANDIGDTASANPKK